MKPPRKFKSIEEARAALAEDCAARLEKRTGRAWSPELRDEVRAALADDPAYEVDRKVAAKLLRGVKAATERAASPDMDEEFRQFVADRLVPHLQMFEALASVPVRRDERARLVQQFDAPADVGGFLNTSREATPLDLACLHILVSEQPAAIFLQKDVDPLRDALRREAGTMRKTRARYGLPTCPVLPAEGTLAARVMLNIVAFKRRQERQWYIARLYRGPATGHK